jgi:ABC-type uncharacterized transport system permease subunit
MIQFYTTIALIFYTVMLAHQVASMRFSWRCPRLAELVLSCLAIVAHGWLLHLWIDVPGGQNLSFLNMVSLIIWMVAVITWLMTLFEPLGVMWVIITPLAMVSIVLRLLFPDPMYTHMMADHAALVHVLLGVLVVGIICMAGLQAGVLMMQRYSLKHKQAPFLLQRLPALETMEMLLFQLLLVGFVLLTIALASSFYFYINLLPTHAYLLHKTFAVLSAWCVFAVVLLGHRLFGWRGYRAVVATLVGMLILVVVYLLG